MILSFPFHALSLGDSLAKKPDITSFLSCRSLRLELTWSNAFSRKVSESNKTSIPFLLAFPFSSWFDFNMGRAVNHKTDNKQALSIWILVDKLKQLRGRAICFKSNRQIEIACNRHHLCPIAGNRYLVMREEESLLSRLKGLFKSFLASTSNYSFW